MFKKQVGLILLLASVGLNAWAIVSDPTRPATYHGPGPAGLIESHAQELVVNSVLVSPDRNVAVINGHPRKLGETFEGMQVVEIHEGGVRLKTPSGMKELKLHPQAIKSSGKESN